MAFEGVSFSYDDSLATGVEPQLVPSSDIEGVPPWEVVPEHKLFWFTGYVLPDTFHRPRIMVYPVGEYDALNPMMAVRADPELGPGPPAARQRRRHQGSARVGGNAQSGAHLRGSQAGRRVTCFQKSGYASTLETSPTSVTSLDRCCLASPQRHSKSPTRPTSIIERPATCLEAGQVSDGRWTP